MPRVARHAVVWRPDDERYALSSEEMVAHAIRRDDADGWQAWLTTVEAFAFRGEAGTIGVRRETRVRGGAYWHAYRRVDGRTRKQYLGATETVTLARLEGVAQAFATKSVASALDSDEGMTIGDLPGETGALPATKLLPPRPQTTMVPRERLLRALAAADTLPLTVVIAPAGWGKTTLLAAWVSRRTERVAWLALDRADDSPARFWAGVIAALRTRLPGIGASALALLRSPQPPPLDSIVTALLNDLVAPGPGAPTTLLLDDCQSLTDPAIWESLAFFLAHLPPGLRLLVASRHDPDLPLARLRAGGQLAEFRATDLGFTVEEVDLFAERLLGSPLTPDEAAALTTRTEGWAAGVQLAALALGHNADRDAWLASFTGSHRYLLDYVEEEILAWQPPAVRQFLLRSAVLSRLGAAVCAAVTGEAASASTLEALERANLFLIPLDEGRQWYRLHDLFREALLARAMREPGLLPEAHRRAARWHADYGDAREAIAHAQAAGDHPLAAELIAREAPRLWLTGEARTVHSWLLALPDDVLLRHARLALDGAMRLLDSLHSVANASYAEALHQVEQTLGRVEEGLRAPGAAALPEAEIVVIRRRLRLLRAWIEARLRLVSLDVAGLAALEAEIAGLSEREEVHWKSIWLSFRFWLYYSLRREGPSLLTQFLAFKAEVREADEARTSLTVSLWLGHIYAAAGQLRLSERESLEGLAMAERRGLHVASVGYLHLLLAGIYYARDQLEASAAALRAVLSIARVWQQIDLLIIALRDQASVALAKGDLAAAEAILREAEAIIRREQAVYQAPLIEAVRVQYWLALGDLASAARWSARNAFDPHNWVPSRAVAFTAQVRVDLAQRHYARALEQLDQFAVQLDRPGDLLETAEYLALRLLALHGLGANQESRAVAARLLALTVPEGWVRLYLDEGPPMEAALLALVALDGTADGGETLPSASLSLLLAAFEAERQAASADGGTSAPVAATTTSIAVEALTTREREVLRRLATGASNATIAEALSISPFTVKRHVGNLLGKLGAASRTEAVARARAAELI